MKGKKLYEFCKGVLRAGVFFPLNPSQSCASECNGFSLKSPLVVVVVGGDNVALNDNHSTFNPSYTHPNPPSCVMNSWSLWQD
jgi:hypothetical protein